MTALFIKSISDPVRVGHRIPSGAAGYRRSDRMDHRKEYQKPEADVIVFSDEDIRCVWVSIPGNTKPEEGGPHIN